MSNGQPRARDRTKWWPRLRLAVSVVILAAGIVAAIDRRDQVVQAAHRINTLQPVWLLLAAAFETLSMIAFAELQRGLLRQGGAAVARQTMLQITLAANAMSLSVPGGPAVSTGWSYAELRRRGVERVLSGWAVLMAGALSSFALFVTLAVGAWVAGSKGPAASLRGVALGLAAIPVAAAAVLLMRRRSPRLRQWLADHPRWRPLRRLLAQVVLVRPSPAGWATAAAVAAINWVADAGCLAAAIYAVGAGVPWRGILVAYGLGQLAAVLPFTPGGVAVVEASLTAVLVAYGLPPGSAIAAVVVYRVISFWLVVPIGWIAYAVLSFSDGERTRHPWRGGEAHAQI